MSQQGRGDGWLTRQRRSVGAILWLALTAMPIACTDRSVIAPARPALTTASGKGMDETWTYDLLGNIGGSPGTYFEAFAINDSGTIAGAGTDPATGRTAAWRWRAGAFSKSAPFVAEAAGYAINGRGEVFGTWTDNKGDWPSAMIWQFKQFGAVMSSYRRLSSTSVVVGSDLNDAGQAVGWECVPFGVGDFCKLQALFWEPTRPPTTYLPTVEGMGFVLGESSAMAINAIGDVLGHTRDDFDQNRAWVRLRGREIALLPLPSSFDDTWPGDINNMGIVVGVTRSGTYPCRFVKWTSVTSPPTDISTPAPVNCPVWPSFRGEIRISDRSRVVLSLGGHSDAYTVRDTVGALLPVPANAASILIGGINSCGEIVGTIVYARHEAAAEAIRWRRLLGGVPVCD